MVRISLIIPVYNEEKRIASILRSLSALLTVNAHFKNRVFFLLDGCTDSTESKINSDDLGKKCELTLKKSTERTGKLNIINNYIAEILETNSDYYCLIDSDVRFPADLVLKNYLKLTYEPAIIAFKITFEPVRSKTLRKWAEISSAVYHEMRTEAALENRLWFISGNFILLNKDAVSTIFPLKTTVINDDAYIGCLCLSEGILVIYSADEIITTYPVSLSSFIRQKFRVRVGFYELENFCSINISAFRRTIIKKAIKLLIRERAWDCIHLLLMDVFLGAYSKLSWKLHATGLKVWKRIN